MSELDELSEEGRDVGACNTISLQERHGRRVYVGTNTDVVGIREAFFQNVTDPTGLFFDRPGLVIGGGGAARSAVYTMRRWMRCSPIYIVNRDKSEVDAVISSFKGKRWAGELIPVDSCKDAQRLEAPGAIVSCIPDFPPKTPKEHETREVIMTMLNKPHKGAILEMCYHPAPWTAIAEISAEAGWQVILGTEAMIWQALEQQRLWTGRPLNDMPVKEVKGLVAKAISDPLAPRHKL
ncbi:hypothetical protein MMC10_000996 [Thelotrema lepadinum]|nr:hypothetical protein [Thelotrema lepadinum]